MKPVPNQTQSPELLHGIAYQTDPAQLADELDYLELLLPELAHTSTRNLQQYALAYVERYPTDVMQLEHEWQLLYAALLHSAQRADYPIVVRLVQALTYIVGRIYNPTVTEYMMQLGIEACQHIQDYQHLTSFQNRLGGLLFSHGKYQEGRHLWYTSLRQAETFGCTPGIWEPLASFAHIADILSSYKETQRFTETIEHLPEHEHSDCFLAAIFIKGFRARVTNNLAQAQDDLKYSLQLLSAQNKYSHPSFYRQLFTMAAQTELARVQGDYARSQAYAETSHSLAHLFGDHYTAGSLLIDQMFFTYRQEHFADTHTAFLRLYTLSQQCAYPNFISYCHFLEQQFSAHFPKLPRNTQLAIPTTASSPFQEALSEREIEVLQLIANGLSNREIATQLVITIGTVKKHLEHAYAKLQVHSRTAAIARARSLSLLA